MNHNREYVKMVPNQSAVPERTGMMSAKPIEKTALVNLYNIGGKDFLLKMIDNFVAQSPKRIASARKSLGEADLKAIHLIAHSLKASAANLGAIKVQEVSERLEEMASIGLREHIGESLDRVEEILEEAIQSLQAERELWGRETAPNP